MDWYRFGTRGLSEKPIAQLPALFLHTVGELTPVFMQTLRTAFSAALLHNEQAEIGATST